MSRALIFGPIFDNALMGLDEFRSAMNRKTDFYPYDVKVTKDKYSKKPLSYTIEIALAGIEKDWITIQLTDEGGLKVTVLPENKLNENEELLRNNISYGKKSIIFDLTKDVDIKGIESKFNNGLLSIKIPMITKKPIARSIKIS